MENSQKETQRKRRKRAFRVRKGVRGVTDKPRLSVVKSNNHVYIQLIDDEKTATVASTSTRAKEFRTTEHNCKSIASAKQLGLAIAAKAKDRGVQRVVFDRGRFKYHGIIAAVAEGAREGGLEF